MKTIWHFNSKSVLPRFNYGKPILLNEFPCNVDKSFGRTIDEILDSGFFNSFDSNIYENDGNYVCEIAVPGFSKNNLSIDVRDGVLRISGQKEYQNKFGHRINSIEFETKSINRSFKLPSDTEVNKITSRCSDGLLTINIPKKKEEIEYYKVEISGGRKAVTDNERSINDKNVVSNVFDKIRGWFK